MRWSKGERSSNLDDQRGAGGGGGFRLPGGKLSIGGIILAIVIVVVARKFGGGSTGSAVNDVLSSLTKGQGQSQASGAAPAGPDPDAELVEFMNFLVKDNEATWQKLLGAKYRAPKLTLFTSQVQTACGAADSGIGPFYCPGDEHVYIDLAFYRELATRFAAPGDFAQAYVFAHEVGHHIQMLLGFTERAGRSNQDSIRLELQADCLAGVWGHYGQERKLLEPGDIEEGLKAASAVGDDTLQRQATGRVSPETWTHGSAEQRQKWFRRGFDSGDVGRCDTFAETP